MTALERTADPPLLPEVFSRWFAQRGWTPRAHQLELLSRARDGRSVLLIAPTGGGKTLAGFLPSLVELYERGAKPRRLVSTGKDLHRSQGLHTLYISPLKALAVDIARNLETPVAEMKLPIRIETRTGDTPASKRQRQRRDPPDIMLTTPEQLALLLASADAPYLFGSLKRVVLDELHALVTSKRGDLLSLGLARLFRLAPGLTIIGLSATVAEPEDLSRFLVPQPEHGQARSDLVIADGGAEPQVTMMEPGEYLPWAGHSARHAFPQIYELIKQHKMTLVFVNTRSQAEMIFHALWHLNEDSLAIALHHGSLDVEQRRKVEKAMAGGKLRAVVCTSSLDLGIDWGDIDLVVNVGAPKGASRLLQRIGRANHRLDEPSRGVLVPANRFEVLECRAAIGAVADHAQDTPPLRTGALDVLAQHVLGSACGEPFIADELYREVKTAAPYSGLTRADFDAAVDFVATGGYALKAYERFAKIRQTKDGRWRVSHPMVAQRYRMNVGTIVEADMLKVRLVRSRSGGAGRTGPIARGGRVLGEVEEYFIEMLTPGDTFVFAGEILKYEALVENEVYVSRSNATDPKVPSYEGGKFPLSTYLADRVRGIMAEPQAMGSVAGPGSRMARDPEMALVGAGPARASGRDLSARRQALPDLLSVRRPPGARDARHAADAATGARAAEAARLRRQRIRAGGLGLGRHRAAYRARRTVARRAVRRGHAGRRPRSLASGIRADEAHVPNLRDHRRADRAALSRRGEVAAAGHDLDRSGLRRTAQTPARSCVIARRTRGRRHGAARHPAARRNAVARPGANHS